MDNLFTQNLSVIKDRWPELANTVAQQDTRHLTANLVQGLDQTISINDVQLTSRHSRLKEAELQSAQIDDHQAYISLYGTAIGDVQNVLLQRKQLKKLSVYILNEAIFSLILNHTDQRNWLMDERVSLQSAIASKKIIHPFIVIPAELELASDHHAFTRNHLLSALQADYIDKLHHIENPEIQLRLTESIPLIEADNDVGELFNTQRNKDFFVVGAGPSLEQYYGHIENILSREDPPLIIAVDTIAQALILKGIKPDYVVTSDFEIEEKHLPIEASTDIPLIYLPRIKRAVLEKWAGPRYTSYAKTPIYKDINQTHPKNHLYLGGSVIHPAIDLAVKMGASTITLFGCDFAFIDGKTHSYWPAGELDVSAQEAKDWLLNGDGEKVYTHPNFRSYLCNLEQYIYEHSNITFYNSSRKGAQITGTHYMTECV